MNEKKGKLSKRHQRERVETEERTAPMTKVIAQEFDDAYPLAEMRLMERNPRLGDVDAISESIRENGFYGAIIIQRSTGNILAGNHRYKAAIAEGLTTAPALILDVSDEQGRKIAVSDNRTATLGSFDETALAELLTSISADVGGLAGSGFDQEAYEELLAKVADEALASQPLPADEAAVDQAAQLQEKWQTERGQVWEIPSKTAKGKSHRLMCGDSTSLPDITVLMAGEKADMVFTDPPYNCSYEGYTEQKLTIINDAMTAEQFTAFLAAAFQSFRAAVKPTASLYVCHSSSWQREFQNAIEAAGFTVRCQIIWAKNTFAWGFSRYKFQHEPIFCCHVTRQKDPWYGDKSQSTLWQEKKPAANRMHPTMKPLELTMRALVNSSRPGDLVVDLFGGSGSTMVACEHAGRLANLMELDPGYAAVILERMAGLNLEPRLESSPRNLNSKAA